jgi:hypothetical protein
MEQSCALVGRSSNREWETEASSQGAGEEVEDRLSEQSSSQGQGVQENIGLESGLCAWGCLDRYQGPYKSRLQQGDA